MGDNRAERAAVYPRPRGGTREYPESAAAADGLSPPTRGNPMLNRKNGLSSRSIPAHAGEPPVLSPTAIRRPVYPRPRGGTTPMWDAYLKTTGLSPPTRGNRRGRSVPRRGQGSIPAHAGEPPVLSPTAIRRPVYPRPRGGTTPMWDAYLKTTGLSPPTRGNRAVGKRRRMSARSIPAHAGEPRIGRRFRDSQGVYPRPRGGTYPDDMDDIKSAGLSPPTRGNRNARGLGARAARSIPAHAGEPPTFRAPDAAAAVYPRPRGGTPAQEAGVGVIGGLSPPTRGNPRGYAESAGIHRSIPAHAGEPKRLERELVGL